MKIVIAKIQQKSNLLLQAIRLNRFLRSPHDEDEDGDEQRTCTFSNAKNWTEKEPEMNKVENFKTILELNFIHHKMQEMRHFDSMCVVLCMCMAYLQSIREEYIHNTEELMINR